jgi:hypothetical protein
MPSFMKNLVVALIGTHCGMCLVIEVATHYKKKIQKIIKGINVI